MGTKVIDEIMLYDTYIFQICENKKIPIMRVFQILVRWVCLIKKLVPDTNIDWRMPAEGNRFRNVLFQTKIAQKLLGLQIINYARWKAENHSFSKSTLNTL